MNRLITFILLVNCFLLQAQDDYKRKAHIDFGAGATIFNIPNTLDIKVGQAFATALKLDATFEVKKNFYIGIGLTQNFYSVEKDTFATFVRARSPVLLFLSNYHLVDTKKINFCIGTGIGVNALNYTRNVIVDSIQLEGKVHTQGPSFLINSQFRYYFSKTIGMYLRAQYVVNGGKLTSFTINGVEQDRIEKQPVDDVIFNFRGLSVSLGLSFRF